MTTRIVMADAGPGDALIVHIDDNPAMPWSAVIDGGPPGTAGQTLLPLLRTLTSSGSPPPAIDLLAVTHIDNDHIGGIIEIVRAFNADILGMSIEHAWHNSFAAITNDRRLVRDASLRQHTFAAAARLADPGETRALVGSVTQGEDLTDLLTDAGLAGNAPFGTLLSAGQRAIWAPGPEITIVGPSEAQLERLRHRWNSHVNQQRNTELAARIAATAIDQSVTNLASLVFLLEHGDQRILFTGDARGDRIVAQLRELNLLDRSGRITVDALKVPHHGSARSCTPDLFTAVHADHYLISGNGHNGNPSPITAQRLGKSLRGRTATVSLSHHVDDVIAVLGQYPNIECWLPEDGDSGIAIEL